MCSNLNVLKLDVKTGDQNYETVKVLAKTKLQEIDCISREKSQVKIFKQIDELDITATFEDVLEDGDTITVFKEDVVVEAMAPGRPKIKNIENKTEDEIIVVVHYLLNMKKGEPVFIPGGLVKGLRFDNKSPWSNKLVLYRKEKDRDFRGESIYVGRKYELPVDKPIHELFIDNDGLYMIFEGDNKAKLINPLDGTIEKYESNFRKPIGNKLVIEMENTGTTPLCVVSGPRANFDVSPVINGGTKEQITIRKGKKFEFGLIMEDVHKENEFRVKMFDARECNGIKKIQIWQSEEDKIGAAMVLTGRTDPVPMCLTRDKHYREEDRATIKMPWS